MYGIFLLLACLGAGTLFFSMGFHQWGRWTVKRPFLWGFVILITVFAINGVAYVWEYIFGHLAWGALIIVAIVIYQVGSYLLENKNKDSD